MNLKVSIGEWSQSIKLCIAAFIVIALLQGCCKLGGGVCKLPPSSNSGQRTSLELQQQS
jgi:hypothetical protein